MKSFLTLATLLLAITANASFLGNWAGFGSWKFRGQGDGTHCPSMTMTWSETSSSIGIEKGYFDCEVVGMELGQTNWKLQDGQLIDENNTVVGNYDGVHLAVEMPSPNEKTTISIHITRVANHLEYQEVWYSAVEKVYVIEGRLFTSGQ